MAYPHERQGEAALLHLAEKSYDRSMRAVTLLVERVRNDLPTSLDAAIAQARRVWWDRIDPPSTLFEFRIACWRLLDAKGHGSVIVDREDHAVRALLCCLYAVEDDTEPALSIDFALDMLKHLGVDDAAIVSAVEQSMRS